MKMLTLHFHEVIGKTEEFERRKCFMFDDYVLHKIIGIGKFEDTKVVMPQPINCQMISL